MCVTFDVNFNIRETLRLHADKSPVFRRMLDSGMSKSKSGLISIEETNYPEMNAVVRFCYIADISCTDEVRLEEVLKIAHKYEISYLKYRCAEELCMRIDEMNVAGMLRFLKHYSVEQLHQASVKFLKENFGQGLSIRR
ncbi:hypothetical protein R1sor_026684 [Riccia sorocarpa]|uniref:BTB domain-containing protein n=1 Tax=Riccia sorocarpa TaxID=122646 RepID=A0ABD3GFR8_9MARC